MRNRSPERDWRQVDSLQQQQPVVVPTPPMGQQQRLQQQRSKDGQQQQQQQYDGPFVGKARALKDYTPSPYDREALRFKVRLSLNLY